VKRKTNVLHSSHDVKGFPPLRRGGPAKGFHMDRQDVLSLIVRSRIVGIVRTEDAEDAVATARALLDAGLPVVEVSLTTPGGLDAISDLAATGLIGAGTVLDAETARLAIAAGAGFLVSPHVDPDVVATAHRSGVPAIPGAATPTEIVRALDAGADLVKLFPAGALGIDWFRAVRAALPQAAYVPTGGIDATTAGDWIAAGALAVGVGGALTRGSADEVQRAVRSLLGAVGGSTGASADLHHRA
jgi:2-dehydro-3-deoxyphosphogluconate aldolase / (4S)-4-hydroxy-2-oxoglutarate aldolase